MADDRWSRVDRRSGEDRRSGADSRSVEERRVVGERRSNSKIRAGRRAVLTGITQEERDEVRREALMRAVAIVERYQAANSRRLRVSDICTGIMRLIKEEAGHFVTDRSGATAIEYALIAGALSIAMATA